VAKAKKSKMPAALKKYWATHKRKGAKKSEEKGESRRKRATERKSGGERKEAKKPAKKWAQKASARMAKKGTKGSLTRMAKRSGMSTMAYAKAHYNSPGAVGKKARFAANINKGRRKKKKA